MVGDSAQYCELFINMVLSWRRGVNRFVRSPATVVCCCLRRGAPCPIYFLPGSHMIILKVPYAEKDEAKALGAKWNSARKAWYVPDGQAATAFAKWMAPGQADTGATTGKPGRVDAAAGKPIVGAHFIELAHACNPFEACAECAPALASAGWTAAYGAAKASLAAVKR
jgi:hypothetical protein